MPATRILKDADGKAIPQYWDTALAKWMTDEGKRAIIDSNNNILDLNQAEDGTNLIPVADYGYTGALWIPKKVTSEGNLNVSQTARNVSLLDAETLTWNGVLTEQNTADISVPSGKEVVVRINNGADQPLTVTFEYKVGANYIDYYGVDGNELTFDIAASTHHIFGPIQNFPRFDGGHIVITAGIAPTDTNTTVIQVQEV